ncbi:hypothetical protein Phi4:1_gp131 [Cellulophaga phage phi4:1]|uniref:Uncharacterized protein n=5 Tax=Lightbulbvirus TaxID=1918522 RepID=A0A0S2MWN2_9CAUD|nr:hypothetical protein Phi4:1_gp131 [Cellulophaga phage phi4:1]YP_008241630.1 hypothetical protein Phi17:2_gp135 [Cellulophaga phage phi17:2]ALO80140.1 hypothetical protein Phi4113_131 [Cellulophaga phage phi4:1_13]ALO80337.1 hypothetical protein Phi4118_131 [Cellulophaga phage phi4:1_18]ALO80538.1 hypothetical protein Phi17218_135 [Cellulophaga phage phi17:2_18]AGO47668.1 hypothetical protein Phi17:2_gp135 [Cellulophaga phage phi17:2]AGO49544.1 hypothetical protein Phi4:1_gp131 [Cellulophag
MVNTTELRDTKTIREDIRVLLKDYNKLNLINGEDYQALKKELDYTIKELKNNEMYLFIEAQNITHKRLNKVIPNALILIKNIIGEKYLNMDNSINHKYKNYFDSVEQEEKKELKNYTYRITTRTRVVHNNFVIDVSIRVWNKNGSADYSNVKYLATFENGTSFKDLYGFDEEFNTYNLKAEVKKMHKYEQLKKELEETRLKLNTSFTEKFLYGYRKDSY